MSRPESYAGAHVRPTTPRATVTEVKTVGHGTIPAQALASLLHAANVMCVVDVRSFPGSRHNPQFGREEMERWLPDAGIDYAWICELGGRRRPSADSKNVALRHEAFRAYADYMQTPAFLGGVDDLLALAATQPTAVMCSESVWWRCHRRLLADYLVLVRGIEVFHLMHDNRITPHSPTDGVRVVDHGLVYDIAVAPPLPLD